MMLEEKTEWQQQHESGKQKVHFYYFTDSVAFAIITNEITNLECVSFLLSITT